jgi:hypothetical protein
MVRRLRLLFDGPRESDKSEFPHLKHESCSEMIHRMEWGTESDKVPKSQIVKKKFRLIRNLTDYAVHKLRVELSHSMPVKRRRRTFSIVIQVHNYDVVFANVNSWTGQFEIYGKITTTYAITSYATFVETVISVPVPTISA